MLGRADIEREWLFERCREVEADPDGHLDLWAREHGKSSIITFGLTIRDILASHGDQRIVPRELTVGIFSHNRPTAKGFLRQIKTEFERNSFLTGLFPDVFWPNPRRDAPKWSEDDGIVLRRTTNPKEATVEAWGLVDGMPTGKHFGLLVYDDVVTEKSVTTPDMIAKTTNAWELSQNLGSEGGKVRYIGTRYHFCLSPDTEITMSDWTQRRICDVNVGDEVVGWELRGGKRWIVRTKVKSTGKYENQPVFIYQLADGRQVTCTDAHKWWKGPHGSGEEYKQIGLEYHRLKSLRRLMVPASEDQSKLAGYLAGLYDADGTFRKNTHHPSGVVVYTQSDHHEGRMIEAIKEALRGKQFEFAEHWTMSTNEKWRDRVNIAVNGGWRERYRFLREVSPNKRGPIVESLYGQLVTEKIDIQSREPGFSDVHWIETETGNYIADGYCSKNSDTYGAMIRRESVIPRIHPATKDGTVDGEPVLLTKEALAKKRRDQGPYTFASQQLLNPVADAAQGFKREWLMHYGSCKADSMNRYVLVDPASGKKKENDYTSLWVIGLADDRNYYVLDMVRDRLNLTERAALVINKHREWMPKMVGYEKYGMQADIEHIQSEMENLQYRFPIQELAGTLGNLDRVRRLIPVFEQKRLYLPRTLHYTDYEKRVADMVHVFIEEEYVPFPVGIHADMLDSLSRILDDDMNANFPRPRKGPGARPSSVVADTRFDPYAA